MLTVHKAREMLSHLAKAPHSSPRIIWTGSLDGTPQYYDPSDPYAVDSGYSYQSAKFQVSLVAWGFNAVISREQDHDARRIRSFAVNPGVVAGNMFYDICAGPFAILRYQN